MSKTETRTRQGRGFAWSELEAARLSKSVAECEKKHMPMAAAFAMHAKEYNRSMDSVKQKYHLMQKPAKMSKPKMTPTKRPGSITSTPSNDHMSMPGNPMIETIRHMSIDEIDGFARQMVLAELERRRDEIERTIAGLK